MRDTTHKRFSWCNNYLLSHQRCRNLVESLHLRRLIHAIHWGLIDKAGVDSLTGQLIGLRSAMDALEVLNALKALDALSALDVLNALDALNALNVLNALGSATGGS